MANCSATWGTTTSVITSYSIHYTKLYDGALEDTATFFLATTENEAESLLVRRGIKYVLFGEPANAVLEATAIAQPADPPVKVQGDRYKGFSLHLGAGYYRLITTRLFQVV